MTSSERSAIESVPFGARLGSLDGLRGLAVLSVVIFHALHVKGDFGFPGKIWVIYHGSAWAGVDLFFVLSGFLITGILLDSRGQDHYFRNFYARRTLRIFPLYYAVLAVSLILVPAVFTLKRLPAMYPRLLDHQIWLWTYTQNYLQATTAHTLPGFGHFWSLAVEEQFYWFWPLAVYFSSRRVLLRICLAVCCLLPFVRLALVLSGESLWAVRQYTHTRFDTLLYGAIVALVVRDSGLFHRYRKAAIWAGAGALLLLTGIAIQDGSVPYESAETAFLGYSAFGFVFAVLIGYVVTAQSRLSRLLSAKTLTWFGTYSYGIYVFHWPLKQACQALVDPHLTRVHSAWARGMISLLTVLAASSLAAYLSFSLYEQHFLKLKKYFVYSRVAHRNKDIQSTDLLRLAERVQPSLSSAPPEGPTQEVDDKYAKQRS